MSAASRYGAVLALTSLTVFAPSSADVGDNAATLMLKAYWSDLYSLRSARDASGIPLLDAGLLGKATPDECYVGLGEANVYPFDPTTETCDAGQLKVNEAYVFGMTESNGRLWFGSAPNMGCLVYGAIAEAGAPTGLTPYETDTWSCEYGESGFGMQAGFDDRLGDWRPAAAYVYDPDTDLLQEMPVNDPLVDETLGYRSAGSLGNVVFLGGPAVAGVVGSGDDGGINLFAFDSVTGAFLGARRFDEYSNIRKWVVAGGVLYTGVQINKQAFPTDPDVAEGAVLRWTGNASDPFAFEVVGWLDGQGAELTEHDGRLFVTTWPDFTQLVDETFDYAGLWMSPPLGATGLNPDDAAAWRKVWSVSDYEADEVTARLYNGGALASFDGYLYWGTLHGPLSAGFAHAEIYGLFDGAVPDIGGLLAGLFGTHRPISIFRGKNFGTEDEVTEVLYGLNRMPAYVDGLLGKRWKLLPNRMGRARYGPAGFGNSYNTYTWTMQVHDGALYVGTLDWSHTLDEVILPVLIDSFLGLGAFAEFWLPFADYGADLFVFPGGDEPAVAVDRTGLGNYATNGVRTMAVEGDDLYLGMANPMNLMTSTTDRRPEGGWELIRLSSVTCDATDVPGDFNGDGRARRNDRPGFWDCYTGACLQGQCPLVRYDDPCCSVGDFDGDGDVDMADWPRMRAATRRF